MDNRKTIFSLAVAVAILLFLAAAVVALLPNPSANDLLKVSNLGTTNDAAFGLIATLSVTNQGDDKIVICPCTMETLTRGIWSTFIPIYSRIITLPAHTIETIQAPVSTNVEAWRVPVMWWSTKASPVIFIQKEFEINVYRNFQRLGRGEMPHFYGVPSRHGHMVFSPAVTNW